MDEDGGGTISADEFAVSSPILGQLSSYNSHLEIWIFVQFDPSFDPGYFP